MLDRLLERLPPEPRRARILLCAVALVAALFRFPGLGYPVEEYFDEVYHAKTALQYLRGEPPTEWVHPPTAKLLIAVGVALFGYWPWAWRLVPALAGTLLAPVFFLLARRVLATERAALLATLLLLLDGVYLVQSRIAMTNIFAVLFQLLAALLVVRAATAGRLALGAMAAAGLALGLALSTRWTSLFAWGFLGLVFLVARVRRNGSGRDKAPWVLREAVLAFAAFVVLPAAVYLLSYVPWMRQGHSAWEVVTLQKAIWDYHAHLDATHSYFSELVEVAAPLAAHLVLVVVGRRVDPGHRGSREPRPVVGGGPRVGVGGRRPACAGGTRGACSPGPGSSSCTCPGACRRARSTSATTCSKPSPTRALPSASSSTVPGTAAIPCSSGATSSPPPCSSCCSCRS